MSTNKQVRSTSAKVNQTKKQNAKRPVTIKKLPTSSGGKIMFLAVKEWLDRQDQETLDMIWFLDVLRDLDISLDNYGDHVTKLYDLILEYLQAKVTPRGNLTVGTAVTLHAMLAVMGHVNDSI